MKVYEAAKELKIETKTLVDILKGLGRDLKHLSVFPEELRKEVMAFETVKSDVVSQPQIVDPIVYISKSRRFGLGNWKKEVKNNDGSIKEPTKSLDFDDWGYVISPDDPEREAKRKFIEGSVEFGNHVKIGSVKELRAYRLSRLPIIREINRSEPSIADQSILSPEEVMR